MQVAILAAQVDEAHLRANREAGDHRSLDDRVRIVQEDDVVFAGAGLGFVAVDEHIFRMRALLGHERPLQPGREAGAAAAAQAGGLHLVDDPFGRLPEALLQRLIAAQLDIFVDIGRALAKAEGEQPDFIGMGDECRASVSSLSCL